jgi:flagellar motor switch protein FliN/FliY
MSGRPPNFDLLLDVSLELSAELGRATLSVREIVELGTGSIVQLDRAAGGPVDVLVNGKAVARGEVVALDDRYGVRITELCG